MISFATHLSSHLGLIVLLGAIATIDALTRRIPNVLTISAAAAGLLLAYDAGGVSAALQALEGLLVGFCAFLPFYLSGGAGAGDVKAMAAVGAFLSPQGALLAVAWTLVSGALGAVLMLLLRGENSALRALGSRWMWRAYSAYCGTQSSAPAPRADDPTQRRFPYGIAIACGTLVSLAWT